MPHTANAGRAAVQLRLAGATFQDIAETLGFDGPDSARLAVLEGLASEHIETQDRETLRTEEAARIKKLLNGVWQTATDPNSPMQLPATKIALQLIDRHAKLYGLDAPTEVVVHTPTTSAIEQWVSEVLAGGTTYRVIEDDPITTRQIGTA